MKFLRLVARYLWGGELNAPYATETPDISTSTPNQICRKRLDNVPASSEESYFSLLIASGACREPVRGLEKGEVS